MIRSAFDPSIARWVARCSALRCTALVVGRTPRETHDNATALEWTVRHGRGPLCAEHRNYVAPSRSVAERLRSMLSKGTLVGNATARELLREWEAA